MSWMRMLYDTYENCKEVIGNSEFGKLPLLPVSHTTQVAHIEVMLTEDGEWVAFQARVLPKEEGTTVIPCTEDSASRSGTNPPPHPLFDKLQYLCGDYPGYTGVDNQSFHTDYMNQLSDWCNSPYGLPHIKAVYAYLVKNELISDLIRERILYRDDRGFLLDKWNGEADKQPQFFKLFAISQKDAFVRFRIKMKNGSIDNIWNNSEAWSSFSAYYRERQQTYDICYVQGERAAIADKAPSKLRNSGDKAKLISSNDKSGYTFRGRFADKNQAVTVGYETVQKAHNALKWLVDKQGEKYGDQVFVAWGTKGQELGPVFGDGLDYLIPADLWKEAFTREEYAERFNKALAGYKANLEDNDDIVIMGLNAATPGRLSINYYREFKGETLQDNLRYWQESCSWHHCYRKIETEKDAKGKPVYKTIDFFGAPSPKDIVHAVYGSGVNDKLMMAEMERLVPCITDKAKIPVDFVRSVFYRASNPAGMSEQWEYEKTLSIACSLIRKHENEKKKTEVWGMGLENTNDRSYLFGRLLACAEQLETYALFEMNEKNRETNAERYQSHFIRQPAKTWGIIVERLKPYKKRLGIRANRIQMEIDEITDKIGIEKFTNQPLSEIYLLGYSSQRQQFWLEIKNKNNINEEEKENENE